RLPGASQQLLGRVVQRGLSQSGAVFQLELESADLSQPVYRRWRKDCDECILNSAELRVQGARDVEAVLVLAFSLVERLEREEDDSGIRSVDEAIDRESRKLDRVLHPGLLHPDLGNMADHLLGPVQRGS